MLCWLDGGLQRIIRSDGRFPEVPLREKVAVALLAGNFTVCFSQAVIRFLCYNVNGVISQRHLSVGLPEEADVVFGESLQVGTGPDTFLGARYSRQFQVAEHIRRCGKVQRGCFFGNMPQTQTGRQHGTPFVCSKIVQPMPGDGPDFLQVLGAEGAECQNAVRRQDVLALSEELLRLAEPL